MSGLVKNIADLEAEADAVIEKARAEARRVESGAGEEVASYRARLNDELSARVAAYHDEALAGHARMMADARKELQDALDSLARIDEKTIQAQLNRILDQYKNL